MRVRVGDVRLYFDVEGAQLTADGATMRERPTLLLLHGGPGFDHSIFKPAFSKFQDVFQIVYLDHRGNGRSDKGPPERWTFDQWGDDVRAFCDALHIERPIVLGVSFGGFVAQAYATRHPDHARALILCSTSARFHREHVFATFERLGGPQARQAAAAWLENASLQTMGEFLLHCMPLYNRNAMDPAPMQRAVVNFDSTLAFFNGEFHTFNFLPVLNRVRCPTLVLSGDRDPITPIEDGEEMARALPADLVQFRRFPGCGHPVYEDDEAACFAAIRAFLATV